MTEFFADLEAEETPCPAGELALACRVHGQRKPESGARAARSQYLQDLATLDRIEAQDTCFFDAMGEAAARRAQGVSRC